MAARSKTHKARKPTEASAPSSLPYTVDMTATAEAVYVELHRKAKEAETHGDYSSTHITAFEMVKDAVKRIIPQDPINKKHALRGDMSNIFRLRKGRLRICWIASSKMRRVCILFISESLRKEGDASDPYIIFQNMIDSGTLDALFADFGVRMARLRNPAMARSTKTQ
ncbi:MAG: type II toxin-antitoxin system YhaV family toxin [Candidatus Sulfotelmatobacter sp.]